MTDIVDRAKTMIAVIDHSREQSVQHAYSDRVYQDVLAELVAEVEERRDQANAALERVRALATAGGVYEPGPDWVSKQKILNAMEAR